MMRKLRKRETAIGELYKDISTAIDNNTDINIDEKELKQKIIDFMTIEFHRSVIANDSYLEKYRDQQQKRNDIVDCIMLQTGNMTDEQVNIHCIIGNRLNQRKLLDIIRRIF